MHVQVEEPDLGVGDPGERLAVDAHELQEGDEREARREHRRHVAQQLQVVLGERSSAAAEKPAAAQMRLDQRRLEAGLRAASSSVRRPRAAGRGPPCSRRRAGRRRAASRISASECPRSRRRATIRAWATAAGVHAPSRSGTMPLARPAAQGGRRHAEPARDLAQRRLDPRTRPRHKAAEPRRGPAACGQCGPLPRPAAFVRGDALREASRRPHFPAYCLCSGVPRRSNPSKPRPRVRRRAIRRQMRILGLEERRGSARRPAW